MASICLHHLSLSQCVKCEMEGNSIFQIVIRGAYEDYTVKHTGSMNKINFVRNKSKDSKNKLNAEQV